MKCEINQFWMYGVGSALVLGLLGLVVLMILIFIRDWRQD